MFDTNETHLMSILDEHQIKKKSPTLISRETKNAIHANFLLKNQYRLIFKVAQLNSHYGNRRGL